MVAEAAFEVARKGDIYMEEEMRHWVKIMFRVAYSVPHATKCAKCRNRNTFGSQDSINMLTYKNVYIDNLNRNETIIQKLCRFFRESVHTLNHHRIITETNHEPQQINCARLAIISTYKHHESRSLNLMVSMCICINLICGLLHDGVEDLHYKADSYSVSQNLTSFNRSVRSVP